MGDSAIDYLGENGKSWSPIRGCSRVSEGCRNCWSERMAIRFAHPPDDGGEAGESWDTGGVCHGLVRSTPSGPRWTGEVRLIERDLDAPLRWRKPARVAVCFGGDLFHEQVPDEWIDRVFAVMALVPRHQFLVLTKRAERMRAYLSGAGLHGGPDGRWRCVAMEMLADEEASDETAARMAKAHEAWLQRPADAPTWPLPNVWPGVSVEDPDALVRLDYLHATPAARRWVSLEPLIADLGDIRARLLGQCAGCGYTGSLCVAVSKAGAIKCCPDCHHPPLDWLVIGGESGPGARPFKLAWARSVIHQCKAAGVSAFMKQVGARPVYMPSDLSDAQFTELDASKAGYDHGPVTPYLRDRKGASPEEWPADLRVREMPA